MKVTFSAIDAVGRLKSENEIGKKTVAAPWLKSRPELETTIKVTANESSRSVNVLLSWSVRPRVRAF